MSILGSKIKQPREELDYDVLYQRFLTETDELNPGSPPAVTITPSEPGGLEAGAITVNDDGDRVKIWLTGGLDGVQYKVTVRATTNEGRVTEDEFYIIVEEF